MATGTSRVAQSAKLRFNSEAITIPGLNDGNKPPEVSLGAIAAEIIPITFVTESSMGALAVEVVTITGLNDGTKLKQVYPAIGGISRVAQGTNLIGVGAPRVAQKSSLQKFTSIRLAEAANLTYGSNARVAQGVVLINEGTPRIAQNASLQKTVTVRVAQNATFLGLGYVRCAQGATLKYQATSRVAQLSSFIKTSTQRTANKTSLQETSTTRVAQKGLLATTLSSRVAQLGSLSNAPRIAQSATLIGVNYVRIAQGVQLRYQGEVITIPGLNDGSNLIEAGLGALATDPAVLSFNTIEVFLGALGVEIPTIPGLNDGSPLPDVFASTENKVRVANKVTFTPNGFVRLAQRCSLQDARLPVTNYSRVSQLAMLKTLGLSLNGLALALYTWIHSKGLGTAASATKLANAYVDYAYNALAMPLGVPVTPGSLEISRAALIVTLTGLFSSPSIDVTWCAGVETALTTFWASATTAFPGTTTPPIPGTIGTLTLALFATASIGKSGNEFSLATAMAAAIMTWTRGIIVDVDSVPCTIF